MKTLKTHFSSHMDPHLLTPLECIGKGSSATVSTCLENESVVIKQFKRKRDFEMELHGLQTFKDSSLVVEMLGSCSCCRQIVLPRYKSSLEDFIQEHPSNVHINARWTIGVKGEEGEESFDIIFLYESRLG